MSAIKKTNAKATKSPAPATKETKTAAKPAAKKAAPKASAAKTSAAKTDSATAAIVAAVTRATVKEVATKTATTTLSAKVDVGFGNALYVRGDGPGLSWDRGTLMTNVGSDLWQLQLTESARPVTFKFLINNVTWSTGADFTIASGTSETFSPQF